MKKKIQLFINILKSPKGHYVLFVAILLLCSIINFVYMHCSVFDLNSIIDYRYNHSSHLFVLIDLAVVYTLFFLIKRRIYILFIPYIVVMLIAWINVGYSRYFHTYMPFSLYSATENLNGLTANIIDAINLSDTIFAVTGGIVILSYVILCKGNRYKHSYIPIISLYILIFFACIPFLKYNIKEKERLATHFQELNDHRSLLNIILGSIEATHYTSNTFFYYGFIVNAIWHIKENKTQKSIDKALVPYLRGKQYKGNTPPNKRNLILILIESLSSFPINKSYGGKEVTPNINKFINTPNIVFYPNMESQTQLGESSDGQFIYLNGMLPLKNDVTIYKVLKNKLLSLCHLLRDYNSYMIIPTDENEWSQKAMCNAYGITTLYSRNTINDEGYNQWLNDEQLFKYAASLDTTFAQPFCSIILSSSTHSPWNKRFEPSVIEYPSDYSSELKIYLDNVHYLDKWLGYYIESLKQHQLYDNSIIVITADHKPNIPKLNVKSPQPYNNIPLIIMNINKNDFNTAENTYIHQTSLFPTILDVMGVKSDWRGVGKSLYMPDSIRISTYERKRESLEQKISEEIIKSNYFVNL